MKKLLILSMLLIGGCCAKKQTADVPPPPTPPVAGAETLPVPTPPGIGAQARVVLYRTRTDVRDRVPVMLDKDGTTILSYPAPSDLQAEDGLALPVELGQGWLLDRRGVGLNTAFLDISYADYAGMEEVPPLSELQDAILDRDPLTDLCDCGPKASYEDPVRQLQELIHSGMLETHCKRLK